MAEEVKEEVREEAAEEAEAAIEAETPEEPEELEETEAPEEPEAASEKEEAAEDAGNGKKEKKEKKDKKEALIEELQDKVKRQLAEFENFRNRTEREKSTMFEMGAKSVIEKILPVVDNFERGFEGVEPDCDDAFVKGMEQVYKQLSTALEELGITPIEALGADFDPNLHNAVMQEESGEYEPGKVSKELQKGYKYKDTVIRHSMVAVASQS